MKRIIVVAALALLAGCASMSELRDSTPAATFTTTKQPQAVAECIRDAWQNQKIGLSAIGVTMQQSGNNYTVISSIGGPPQQMADVHADGKVDVYGQKDADFGRNAKRRAVAAQPCI